MPRNRRVRPCIDDFATHGGEPTTTQAAAGKPAYGTSQSRPTQESTAPIQAPLIRVNSGDIPAPTGKPWTEPAGGPPARYVIQARWRNQTEYRAVATRAGHITTTRIDIGHDSEYTYRVLAQNHFGVKGPHQVGVTAHVAMPAAERQWEDVPSNLSATMLDPGDVELTWAVPERAGHQVDSYRIYRKPVSDPRSLGDSYRHHVLVAQTSNADTAYIDHTAQPGVTYEYGVAAYRDGYPNPLSSISHRAYART